MPTCESKFNVLDLLLFVLKMLKISIFFQTMVLYMFRNYRLGLHAIIILYKNIFCCFYSLCNTLLHNILTLCCIMNGLYFHIRHILSKIRNKCKNFFCNETISFFILCKKYLIIWKSIYYKIPFECIFIPSKKILIYQVICFIAIELLI